MNYDITGLYVIGYFRLFLHMWIFWIYVICIQLRPIRPQATPFEYHSGFVVKFHHC
jgi:hypothetical protein